MKSIKVFFTIALLLTMIFGYSGVDAAAGKKNLYIYGDLDKKVSTLLVKEFNAIHPEINVDFITMSSSDLFSKHMNDLAGRKVSADILWLREPALYSELVKGGYTLNQNLPAESAIFPGADLGGGAYAVAMDPVVMVYNSERLEKREPPKTRAALIKLLQDKGYSGGIGTVDPDKSDRALLLLTQDSVHGREFRSMARSFGTAGIKQYADYGTLLKAVEKGEVAIGYNIPFSEVINGGYLHNAVKWHFMGDYTLALPHALLTTKVATNPAEAKLWIEFARSIKGQGIISEELNLYSVRAAVKSSVMGNAGVLPGGKVLKVVNGGDDVSRFNPAGIRKGFLLKWKELLKQGR